PAAAAPSTGTRPATPSAPAPPCSTPRCSTRSTRPQPSTSSRRAPTTSPRPSAPACSTSTPTTPRTPNPCRPTGTSSPPTTRRPRCAAKRRSRRQCRCRRDTLLLMTDTVGSLVLDLVEWVGRRERSYQDTMDAWRTSCPRLPVWEEANDHGLVETTVTDDG